MIMFELVDKRTGEIVIREMTILRFERRVGLYFKHGPRSPSNFGWRANSSSLQPVDECHMCGTITVATIKGPGPLCPKCGHERFQGDLSDLHPVYPVESVE